MSQAKEADNGWTPLHTAAYAGKTAVVAKLLASKADVNGAPDAAVGWDGVTPLHEAAGRGHTEVVEQLLAGKAHVNAVDSEYAGMTPLYWAARAGATAVVRQLLEGKADANVQTKEHKTALVIAVGRRQLECVKLLLATSPNYESLVAAVEAARVKPLLFPAINQLLTARLADIHLLPLLLGVHKRLGCDSSVYRAFIVHELSERRVLGLVRGFL